MSVTSKIMSSPWGGTVDLQGEELPTDGYFVGGAVPALVARTVDPLEINFFVARLRGRNLARYVGWWTDSETGQLWVDGSDWYQSLSAALVTARDRGELAIFDIANQSEIRVG